MNLRLPHILRGACVAFLVSASSAFAEHLRNGDFTDGTRYWNVTTPSGMLSSSEKEAVLETRGEAGALNVTGLRKGGRGMPADVRLWQKVTSLEAGRAYRLSFEARTVGSGAKGTVNVRYGKSAKLADGHHNTVGGLPITHFEVTEKWATFSYHFVFNGDNALELPKDLEVCWLIFAVGNVDRFELRGVSLAEAE